MIKSILDGLTIKAQTYWSALFCLGALIVSHSVAVIAESAGVIQVQVLFAMALAAAISLFPIRLNGTLSSFTFSDFFVFLMMFMHGPSAAVLVCVSACMIGSAIVYKNARSYLLSGATAATTTVISAALYGQLLPHAGFITAGGVSIAVYAVLSTLKNVAVLKLMGTKRTCIPWKSYSIVAASMISGGALAMAAFYVGLKYGPLVMFVGIPAGVAILTLAKIIGKSRFSQKSLCKPAPL